MTGTFRTGRRIACIAVLAALPVSACAAGYQAETSRERVTLTSVSGAKGSLTLRNVFFVGPADAGGSLPLYLAIFNGGGSDDQLVSVSSSGAGSGYVPSDSSIPAGGSLFYNNGDASVPVLNGIKTKALVGQTVTVTLTFQQAGALTLTVPVDASGGRPGPTATSSASPSASPSATSSASPSATATPSASATPSATASPSP